MRSFIAHRLLRFGTTLLLFLPLLAFPPLAGALEVAVVKSNSIRPYGEALEGFRSSVPFTVRELPLTKPGNADIVRRIRRMKPDLVLAIGQNALSSISEIEDIPLIYLMVLNLPPSLSKQKNISGVSLYLSPEVYLATLARSFPGKRRIGVIYDEAKSSFFVEKIQHAARARELEIILRKADVPGDVMPLLASLKGRIDLLWLLPDTTVVSPDTMKLLMQYSLQHAIPVISFTSQHIDLGALMTLDIDPFDMGVQAGDIAQRLLSSKDAQRIREEARKGRTTINLKIAGKLWITFSDKVLREVRIIE
ncbi:MAG: ABC transporter substrate-binding protein [Alphaproteobacteria bacterium]|uniref:ABC transporter substrate-binding protein n=1 Tax=Candidatus Nitrobium versatile TaxID=2884831 RepID=A0A953JF93_9BACT|nr:ABC transporter substrate-binding protein [Candidatus Nitrobium versatile]